MFIAPMNLLSARPLIKQILTVENETKCCVITATKEKQSEVKGRVDDCFECSLPSFSLTHSQALLGEQYHVPCSHSLVTGGTKQGNCQRLREESTTRFEGPLTPPLLFFEVLHCLVPTHLSRRGRNKGKTEFTGRMNNKLTHSPPSFIFPMH